MFGTITKEPMMLDVFRVLTSYDDTSYDDEDGRTVDMINAWNGDLAHAALQAADCLCDGEAGWLVHGIARIEDCEVDMVEDWIMVDPTKVQVADLVPLRAPVRDSFLSFARDQLAGAERRRDEYLRKGLELQAEADEADEDEEDED